MDITPLIPADRKVISGYGPGMFRINNTVVRHPVIIFPGLMVPWEPLDPSKLALDDFQPFRDPPEPIEVLLIGTGTTMAFIAPDLRQAIRAMGPVPDVMDTGAACRTYNVLLAEGRHVAAALLPISISQ